MASIFIGKIFTSALQSAWAPITAAPVYAQPQYYQPAQQLSTAEQLRAQRRAAPFIDCAELGYSDMEGINCYGSAAGGGGGE